MTRAFNFEQIRRQNASLRDQALETPMNILPDTPPQH